MFRSVVLSFVCSGALACAGPVGAAHQTAVVQSSCVIDSSWATWAPRPPGFDERVAFQLVTYAGMYRDTVAPGLVIMLTDVGSAPDALPVIRRELERSLIVVPRQIRLVRAKYSYRQLRSWLECYIRGGGVVDVTIWGVRTTDNRVGLSVAADSVRTRVEARLRRLGLPREAFDISIGMVQVGSVS